VTKLQATRKTEMTEALTYGALSLHLRKQIEKLELQQIYDEVLLKKALKLLKEQPCSTKYEQDCNVCNIIELIEQRVNNPRNP